MMEHHGRIRRSVIAGTWYPGDAKTLRDEISRYLVMARPTGLPGELMGLIVPHAGYEFSGAVAAHAYKLLEGLSYEHVIVVSPVHRVYMGAFGVADADYYETPLGLVEIDSEMVDALSATIPLSRVERDGEHSLEIQLPFLQHVLGEFSLLPIMMGDQGLKSCRALADGLVRVIEGRRVLLVASTDLSHYHSYSTAVSLDAVVQRYVEEFDPEGLATSLAAGECEACGGGPTVSVMLAARSLGATAARVLQYANSGDVLGDRSQVVGYLAAGIFGPGA